MHPTRATLYFPNMVLKISDDVCGRRCEGPKWPFFGKLANFNFGSCALLNLKYFRKIILIPKIALATVCRFPYWKFPRFALLPPINGGNVLKKGQKCTKHEFRPFRHLYRPELGLEVTIIHIGNMRRGRASILEGV